MELNENDLENALGGAPREVAFQTDDNILFRDKATDDLKKLREEIVAESTKTPIMKNDELTGEELDNVKAGRRL